jgi:F-type H+-transporting ATPase subunit b
MNFSETALMMVSADGPWWNYPGFELWRFVNLAIFIAAALYLDRRFGRPIREALRSRREGIKRELKRARAERDMALAKLAEVESRLARLDEEVLVIRQQATAEAEAERGRIERSTEIEMAKLRQQARAEIESTGKVVRQQLRELAAEHSLKIAEQHIRKDLRVEDDNRLIALNVEQIGRGIH